MAGRADRGHVEDALGVEVGLHLVVGHHDLRALAGHARRDYFGASHGAGAEQLVRHRALGVQAASPVGTTPVAA